MTIDKTYLGRKLSLWRRVQELLAMMPMTAFSFLEFLMSTREAGRLPLLGLAFVGQAQGLSCKLQASDCPAMPLCPEMFRTKPQIVTETPKP